MTHATNDCDTTQASDHQPVAVRRLPVRFESDDSRVITLPFALSMQHRADHLFQRVDGLSDAQVMRMLVEVRRDYAHRHRNLEQTFVEHYSMAAAMLGQCEAWSPDRRLLAGAYLTMEYAIEAAALFNPSIAAHHDQSDVPEGGVRFLMSLRATGEGHVSSIVFRTGILGANDHVEIDPPARHIHRSRMAPDKHYDTLLFRRKLQEMNVQNEAIDCVLTALPQRFTLAQLQDAVHNTVDLWQQYEHGSDAINAMLWLARSNYHIDLDPRADISELVIFPMCESEARGIEDLRMVQFTDDDGSTTLRGTYTAYDGQHILPMMLEADGSGRIEFHSLNGAVAMNKNHALFPRKVGGHYVMCCRIDGENLYIAYSDYLHFWESAEVLCAPAQPWELMQLGNCGSPIETPEGWLLLTHGVGPMREYAIGAMLLDLEDPTRVIGTLDQPLLRPCEDEREGYVPNVVYTCGAMIHGDRLYMPYAVADKATGMAVMQMDELLNRLLGT